MFLLLFDVMTNRFALGRAYRKGAIAFLPREATRADLIVHPTGRNGFQLRITSARRCVARSPISRCTWSETPPTLSAIPFAVRMIPPRYACKSLRHVGSIMGS